MPTGHETLVRGPLEFAPDIAIEVLSPDDRPSRVSEKVSFYLRAGTEIVWLIDPEERTLTEHRRGDVARIYDETEQVSAAPVLPSFALELPRLFSALPARPE
jgi:Uma2 family endonuclease